MPESLGTSRESRSTELRVYKRWVRLAPKVRVAELGGRPVLGRAAHRRVALELLRAGVPWQTVCTSNLDDPRLTIEDHLGLLEAIKEKYAGQRSRAERRPSDPPGTPDPGPPVSGLSLLQD